MIITDKGHVEHKMMIIPSNISSLEVKQTVDLINKLLIGTPIDEISSKLEFEVKPIIPRFVKEHEVLYDAFYNAFNEFSTRSSDVQFIGKNNFLKQPEFNNIEKVKEILNNFELIKLARWKKKIMELIFILVTKVNYLQMLQ